MAKEKLPLDEPQTGIHRAKLWEIAFYALNNTSTNTYLLLMGSITYFLTGMVGVAVVLASSMVTLMRVWDGVTDPFIGMLVDNTNTKLGKNRPFIIIGNIILFVTSFLMFRLIPHMPTGLRFPAYVVIYMVYIIGYTFQCVVTKSAQTCMTNDPKQRPIFTMFDATYNTLLMSVFFPVWLASSLMPKYTLVSSIPEHAAKIQQFIAENPALEKAVTVRDGVTTLSAFYNPEMWVYMQLFLGILSAVFAVLAVIGISRKDNVKYFGLGTTQKIGLKDYVDVLAHNRGIQMLIVSASSDKLCMSTMSNASVLICLYGIIFGNYALSGSVSAITGVPVALFGVLGIGYVARQLGQKKCLLVGTYGSMVSMAGLALMIIFGHGMDMRMPNFSLTNLATWGGLVMPSNWSFMGLLFVLLFIAVKGFSSMSGNIVVPMTADCADYEVYRTRRYVPGLMGTLFSFVDKLISSLAATIAGLVFAAIGFKDVLPTVETPYSGAIVTATVILFAGMPIIGWLCNVISMKFYPLTKEFMANIQDEIAAIKKTASK